MNSYDVVVVGAATSGSFLARKLAEQGHSVLVIDKLTQETLGKRLDIFHVAKFEFAKHGLPLPKEGDPEWAFEFEDNVTLSPENKYPKCTKNRIVGMHMDKYIALLNRWAEEKGAKFLYGASFLDFVYGEDGKICGLTYEQDGATVEVACKVVADCSGISGVARRKLKDGSRVENFEVSDKDLFYVVLRYVKFNSPDDYLKHGRGWPFYKTWEAPQTDPTGAIYGVGACLSYDFAEKIYAQFEQKIKLPEFTLERIERGTTPYRRPPYSFVTDGFVASGDAACLTKPNNGEGVTSAMVQLQIVAEVLDKALKAGDCSEKALWDINTRYNEGQGGEFSFTRAVLVSAVSAGAKDFEYFFAKDIIFSEKFLQGTDNGELVLSLGDILSMVGNILGGVLTRKLQFSSVKKLVRGLLLGIKLQNHYKAFPKYENVQDYDEWVETANGLWDKIGTMGDTCGE